MTNEAIRLNLMAGFIASDFDNALSQSSDQRSRAFLTMARQLGQQNIDTPDTIIQRMCEFALQCGISQETIDEVVRNASEMVQIYMVDSGFIAGLVHLQELADNAARGMAQN